MRLGIDRDHDGAFDRDELDAGSEASELAALVRVLPEQSTVAVGTPTTLHAQFAALPAPLMGFQWRKNGEALPGETNSSLSLASVAFADDADYSVELLTAFQSWTSTPVRLSVAPALVAIEPSSQQVRLGSNAVFTASVTSASLFTGQWRFDGNAIPGATNLTFVITNLPVAWEGAYHFVIANSFGSVTSAPVFLTVLVNPSTMVPPVSLTVPVGGDATFSFVIAGNPPPFYYQLRRSSTTLTNYSSNERTGFLTLSNVQTNQAGTYRVVVTNVANPSPGLTMPPVTLTVLADADGDGLPDVWESANGFSPNDATDAALDVDADGLSNRDEYLAGTNPRDGSNLLRVEQIEFSGELPAAIVRFVAQAGKTYSVQSRDLIGESPWTTLENIVAHATNRLVAVTNATTAGPTRIYRLATPRVP